MSKVVKFIRNALNWMTVEPMILLYWGAYNMTSTIRQDFFLSIMCYNLYPSNDICQSEYNDTIKHNIESKTAVYLTAANNIEVSVPIILALLAGHWTDIHGRKWPMFVSSVCFMITSFLYYMLCIFPKMTSENLWLLLVPSGILAIGGNFHLFFLTAFSYLGDILSIRKADQKTRTLVFLIAEGCAAGGAPLGLFIGGELFKWKGFWISFLASSLLTFIVVGYCLMKIRNDSVMKNNTTIMTMSEKENRDIYEDPKEKKGNFLKPAINFLHNFTSACFRPRVGDLRLIMGLLFCSKMIGYAGQMMVEGNLLFLYTEETFGWSVDQYSTWFGVYNIFVCIGVIIVGPILNKIFSNPLQAYVASISNGMFYFFVAMSNQNRSWLMWLASVFGVLRVVPSAVVRSVITKIVDSDEVGRIFAVYGATEALMPLFMAPLGTSIFNLSLQQNMDCGSVLYGTTCSFVIGAFIALYTDTIWWSNVDMI